MEGAYRGLDWDLESPVERMVVKRLGKGVGKEAAAGVRNLYPKSWENIGCFTLIPTLEIAPGPGVQEIFRRHFCWERGGGCLCLSLCLPGEIFLTEEIGAEIMIVQWFVGPHHDWYWLDIHTSCPLLYQNLCYYPWIWSGSGSLEHFIWSSS